MNNKMKLTFITLLASLFFMACSSEEQSLSGDNEDKSETRQEETSNQSAEEHENQEANEGQENQEDNEGQENAAENDVKSEDADDQAGDVNGDENDQSNENGSNNRFSLPNTSIPDVSIPDVSVPDVGINLSGQDKEQTEEEETKDQEDSDVEKGGKVDLTNRDNGEDIRFDGDVTFQSGKVHVEGTTNLLPESHVKVYFRADGYQLIGYSKTLTIDETGEISTELQIPDIDSETQLIILFDPTQQEEDGVIEHYGYYGGNISGAFIRLDEEDEELVQRAIYVYEFNPREHKDNVLTIEPPVWEAPKDYGDPHVWIEPEVTQDEKYVYVHAESNLLEGSRVSGSIELERGILIGYNDSMKVLPDGTFKLKIPYPDDQEDIYLTISMNPSINGSLSYIRETYGEEGEFLEGDYIEQVSGAGQSVVLRIDLDE